MKLTWFFFVFFYVVIIHAISLKFATHPEAGLSLEQKIRRRGYPLETHRIITDDDYILTTYRVPHGRSPIVINGTKQHNRSPVLLIHGMGSQAAYFLVNGQNSLAYFLADNGFDVWLLETRGTRSSTGHKYYNADKHLKYWTFSYHEIGIYDIPANIDYIVEKTNEKIFVIGHSQGNTCYFVMTAERPEYNEKIKIGVAYAPTADFKYLDYPLAVFMSYFVELIQMIYEFLQLGVAIPINDSITPLIRLLCSETTYFMQICMNVLSIIGSHESKIISRDIFPLLFSIPPSRISAGQLIHYMQNVKTGNLRQYDYGERGNLKKYKTKTPPAYNFSKVVAPSAIFYAEKDDIITLDSVKETIRLLPNVILDYKVPFKYFNHIDFLFGHNASALVYDPTVQLFNDFDAGKLTKNVDSTN